MSEMKKVVDESFTQYAGAVLQSRALVDVRDCIKPSARQIFYSMLENKLVYSRDFTKTANAVGLAMAHYYIHGDSSCEGVIMRSAQHFSMRYPLIAVQGNSGTLLSSGNWAAQRYTESKLSQISDLLFKDIDKNTISEWRDSSYNNGRKYPAVLPTKGFYNIVNGTMGIGIGAASSIPQFNLKEVNNALIKLLWNSDCDFDEIYCAPDFATGGLLLNESEVKESLKKGSGFSCKLRAVIDYDSDERCLIVKEMPYGVYTNTICGELESILNGDENPGIDRFNDLTGVQPLIKIYLQKTASPDKVIRYLYKKTSLQSHYGINMTMLLDGRFPKVFGWKEALLEFLKHQATVYRRAFEYDLEKIKPRLHIIEGLLIALTDIDRVIALIKQSTSSMAASVALQEQFQLTEAQAKAILEMKLSRLAKLETQKLKDEQAKLQKEAERIEAILNDETLFKKEIEKDLVDVRDKFGDARRTQILNIEGDEEEEPREIKTLSINLTNKNNLIVNETSTLYTQRRNSVGSKFKLDKDEYISTNIVAQNNDIILFFTAGTNNCNCFKLSGADLPVGQKTPLEALLQLSPNEYVIEMTAFNKSNTKPNILFITKKGMIKKSLITEYNTKRKGGIKALDLAADDELISVLFIDKETLSLCTKQGRFLLCNTADIRPIGRVSKGIKGINLDDNDYVVSGHIVPENTETFVSVSESGYIKQTKKAEFNIAGRNTKGQRIQKLKDKQDAIIDCLPIVDQKEILVISSGAQLKIKLQDVPILSKNTQGVKSIKIKENEKVVCLS